MSRLLILFLFFYLNINISAQVFNFKSLTVRDGLSSDEVFDVVQDSLGYLWFATKAGICKYDGYSFITINQHPGYYDNSVLNLFKDYKGRIWFSTYGRRFGYIRNGIMHFHPLSEQINTLSRTFINNIYIDSTEVIWLTTLNGDLFISDPEQKTIIKYYDYSDCQDDDSNRKLLFKPFLNEWIYQMQYCLNENENVERAGLLKNNNWIELDHKNLELLNSFRHNYCMIAENDYLVSVSQYLFRIKNNKIVTQKSLGKNNESIVEIFQDQQGKVWISQIGKGVFRYDTNNLSRPDLHIFDGKTISTILQDNETNFWFTSIHKGIYFIPSLDFPLINGTYGQKIYSFTFINNTIYYSQLLKGCSKIYPGNNWTNFPQKIIDTDSKFEKYHLYSYDNFLLATGENMLFDTTGVSIPKSIKSGPYSLFKQNDSTLLLGDGYYLVRVKLKKSNGGIIVDKDTIVDIGKNFMAIAQDADNVIWIGTLTGLYSYYNGILKNHSKENEVFSSRITVLQGFNEYLLVGTTTKGILFLRNDTLQVITKEDGLSSAAISSLYIENDSSIWVGANGGLNKIVFHNFNDFEYHIECFTSIDGFPAQEITEIRKHNREIYLATENGIVYFDPDEISKSDIVPRIILEYLIANNEDTIVGNDLTFQYNQNNIEFYYKALAFKNPGKIIYSYTLIGQDKNPVITSGLMARYPKLMHGSYTFEVKASFDGIHFSEPVAVNFKIDKHFTHTAWFKILVVLFLISIIVFIVFYLLRSQKRKHEVGRKILLSEQKALRMQINPHFFFNSLGSIQRFIVNNDTETAQQYLNDFSSLIRLVLENSKYNSVFMDKELEMIRLYVELENKRFSNKINFEIIISEDIHPNEIKIPPLLIQPLIENAIWHGITPKKTGGKISIHFSIYDISNNLLLCKISDDGIGRRKSSEINKRREKYRTSMGLKNVEERISLINSMYKTKMSLRIIDKYEGDKSTGTEVQVTVYYI